jgi:DNA ligase-1
MHLDVVVDTWRTVRATRSRNAKRDALAGLLAEADTVLPVVAAWLSGTLPQGRIGVGPKLLRTVRAELGPAPERSVHTVEAVDRVFSRILHESGPGSTARRTVQLRTLLTGCTDDARTLLVQVLLGELRQGATEGVFLEAVAKAADVHPHVVQRAFMLAGDLPDVTVTALRRGEQGLAAYRITLFRPLRPMLAATAETPAQAMVLIGGDAYVDHKLDGVRLQVHRDGDEVRAYTRRLHDVTAMVPDVVESVRKLPWTRLIVDAEAIALTPEGRPRPFQETMRRFGRRIDVENMRYEVPLTLQVFDALLLGDDEVLDWPAERRFRMLQALPPRLAVARRRVSGPDEADDAYEAAVDAGHEGVMVKDPSGVYQAGARGRAWLKVKPTHTLDLLVLAAEWGSGRRTGRLSNLHLGALDPTTGEPTMLGKTFKGLTDDLLEWQTEALLARETHRDAHTVYVRPELVVEIAFNDVQRSPQYPGGVALRFARVKRYRPDKTTSDADTLDAVLALAPAST